MVNRFALAYREQQQLFLFDKTYIWGTLLKVGGLATLLARFIVQFFWNPTVALVLTLLLLVLSAYMTWAFVRESRKDWKVIPLCLVPSVFIGASLADNSLHFEFLTSILLVQAGLLLYKNIKSRKIFWGVILTIILYLTAGSAGILFAVCAALSGLVGEQRRTTGFWPLLFIPVAAACGAAAAFAGLLIYKFILSRFMSALGASVVSAALHAVGQLAGASLLLSDGAIFRYSPVMLVSSVVTGAFNGFVCILILRKLTYRPEKDHA